MLIEVKDPAERVEKKMEVFRELKEKGEYDFIDEHPRESVEAFIEGIILNEFIPTIPTPKQALFLLSDEPEVLYGGAAGGGKSEGLLMAALQYVHVEDYRALLLRRNYPELTLPGGLIDRAHQWLHSTDAEWAGEKKTWRFPSGATLTFGHIDVDRDKYRYQSTEFQFIGFDELTEFTEHQYLFLFSRLRKTSDNPVPLRMRAATNPTGSGLRWVRKRFILDEEAHFIPATFRDNPFLDSGYLDSLKKLDPITRRQLKDGDWMAEEKGGLFDEKWFQRFALDPPNLLRRVRFWDIASTPPSAGKDPDWTVGTLMGVDANGYYYVLDVDRFQASARDVEERILWNAEKDGQDTIILIEQEPGASGKMVVDYFKRKLDGKIVYGVRPVKDKFQRARPLSSYAEAGRVFVRDAPWSDDFLYELSVFPRPGVHDDQVDSVCGAFNYLIQRGGSDLAVYGAVTRGKGRFGHEVT